MYYFTLVLPSNEKKKVFYSQPRGISIIVLASNFIEIAITINDVVYVIDSRQKEKILILTTVCLQTL